MRYDFKEKLGLNYEKGIWVPISYLSGCNVKNYRTIKKGLGYISNPVTLEFDFDESIYHNLSSSTSSWESDVSNGAIFKGLSVNMVSTRHPDEDNILFHSEDDPWIKHLNALLDTCIE